jgi:molecular chaperone GrpE
MAFSTITKILTSRQAYTLFRRIPVRGFSEEEKIQDKKEQSDSDELDKIKELENKIKTLENESLQYKDFYIRAVAEQENIRKRLTKEIENEGNYAITKFAKEIIEVSDNLSRAIDNVKVDGTQDLSKTLKDFTEGVTMTRSILNNVFNKFHITEYHPLGEKFNPNIHEALFAYEDKAKEPGTIGQVVANGYKIKDRVLRSAKVGVIKK